MNRIFLAFCALSLLAFPTSARADVTLKPSATITGSIIHLGDFFANAGTEAKVAVASAPAVGMRATYSSAWLAALANQYHLNWAPSSDFDQASIVRASRYIDAGAIAKRLLGAIGPAVGEGEPKIRFDNPAVRLLVPAEASDAMAVEGLKLDRRTGRFSAYVSAPPGAVDAQRVRVSGRLVVDIPVEVPIRAIAANQVLTAGDLERITLPRERLALDTLTDARQLVGKAAVHVLRADQPVRAGDVQDPLLVHKGELVTIEIHTPTMRLSTQGKALDDGALGASIRVANTRSKRIIDVVVTGADIVRAGLAQTYAER